MSRIVDDEPPIKSHPASKEYRANYDRTFGRELRATPEDFVPEEAHAARGVCVHCGRTLDKYGSCPDL